MKDWIRLARLPFLSVTVGAITVGALYSLWHDGVFSLARFFMALAAGVFLHLAVNISNDYFDYRAGTDEANTRAIPPFSGGSRVLLEGKVSPSAALVVSVVLVILGGGIGLYLNHILPGNFLLYLGLVGVALIFSYNSGIKLVNFYLGEVVVVVAWGLMVVGSYYVQSGKFTPDILPLALFLGILTLLILFINEFADEEADRRSGRRMWIHLFGRDGAPYVYLVLVAVAYGFLLYGVFTGAVPPLALISLVGVFPLVGAALHARKNLNEPQEKFLPAVLKTINGYNLNFLLLAVALIFSKFV